jgi:hypothetical protein
MTLTMTMGGLLAPLTAVPFSHESRSYIQHMIIKSKLTYMEIRCYYGNYIVQYYSR